MKAEPCRNAYPRLRRAGYSHALADREGREDYARSVRPKTSRNPFTWTLYTLGRGIWQAARLSRVVYEWLVRRFQEHILRRRECGPGRVCRLIMWAWEERRRRSRAVESRRWYWERLLDPTYGSTVRERIATVLSKLDPSTKAGRELHERALRDLSRVDPETGDFPEMKSLDTPEETPDEGARRFRSMG